MRQCGFPLQMMLYLVSDMILVIQMFQTNNPNEKLTWDEIEMELGFQKSE
jgi:hypothetical protein